MNTSRTLSTRSGVPTDLFDIAEEDGKGVATTRSSRPPDFTAMSRSRGVPTSSRSHASQKPLTTSTDRHHMNLMLDDEWQEQKDVPPATSRPSPNSNALFNPNSPTGTTTFCTHDHLFETTQHDPLGQSLPPDTTHPGHLPSRKQTSVGINWWECGGRSYPHWVLRLCTAIVVVPLVSCGFLFSPVLAASMLTTIVLCTCTYEHAWLSFRIHTRLLRTYQWYEGLEGPIETEDVPLETSRRNALAVRAYVETGDRRFSTSCLSTPFTQSTASFPASTMMNLDGTHKDRVSFADLEEAREAKRWPSRFDVEGAQGILLETATIVFRGNLWLTRLVVAVLCTICWSVVATELLPFVSFPVATTPSSIASAPYYFWVVNFVAALCTVQCPTVPCAISLVVQKAAFEVLLLNTFNCPLAAFVPCSASPLTPIQTFALGALAIVLVHALSASGPANFVVAVTLDLLGYAYIAGALGLLITMVDPSDSHATWATVWLGMLSVMWVAQFSGYVCDAIMKRFQLRHMKVLPSHSVTTLNIEASLSAMVASSLLLVFGEYVLNVPGGVVPKVLFSITCVLMVRFGHMILVLIKNAAGVRWTGRLLPGFGGVLDVSHALLFTSIVFVQYHLYIMGPRSGSSAEI